MRAHQWNDDLDEKLIRLRGDGKRAREVSELLGIPRSSVQVRAKELGFPFQRVIPNVTERVIRPKFEIEDRPLRTATGGPEPLFIGFMDLGDSHCREVVGKGEDGLATYCGHPKKRDSSYCDHHSAINEYLSEAKPKPYSRSERRVA